MRGLKRILSLNPEVLKLLRSQEADAPCVLPAESEELPGALGLLQFLKDRPRGVFVKHLCISRDSVFI